jgi:cell division protein FtsB
VNWRRLHAQFGIAAPRVAIRTHLPWYWRALGAIVVLSLSIVLGAWGYDLVRQLGFGERGKADAEIMRLRQRITALERELTSLHGDPAINGSELQIARKTQDELVRQLKTLQTENGQLKEDLALFERLAATEGDESGMSINGLRVERDSVPGQYRYRLLVAVPGGKKGEEFHASLQLIVALRQQGKRVMMILPAKNDPNRQRFEFSIRHFRRVDGTFQVPDGALPTKVEARLIEGGDTKASQIVDL